MKFRLANREKESMLNALFPRFSERLQVACLRYSPLHFDSVLVTSSDDIDRGDFSIDDCYLISIWWHEEGGIDVIFEDGDAYQTGTPEGLPDSTSAWCEYGPLGGDDTQRFYADFKQGTAILVSAYYNKAALSWRLAHPDAEHSATAMAFDRFMTWDDIDRAMENERKRRGIKTFD